ncbi:MAG: dipicolinate synthase subunit B [Clostridia bacterium]|nr:dipicolinate synthase subunit B [Clostridia bacterium]MBQ1995265.1 dipicolinate synthase subunit B [Clostridia bacterium]
MKKLTFGYALTGSFCTFERSLKQMEYLVSKGVEVCPIMSFNAKNTDTRFGNGEDFCRRIKEITGNEVIDSLVTAEPVGPKKMFDLLIVSPCTGTTLAKLSKGIYDTPVTLAVKSHLRNSRNVLLGVSTNDALSNSAESIGKLFSRKHFYFIPMGQDDYKNKPFSLVCDFERTYEAAISALQNEQIQPLFI